MSHPKDEDAATAKEIEESHDSLHFSQLEQFTTKNDSAVKYF